MLSVLVTVTKSHKQEPQGLQSVFAFQMHKTSAELMLWDQEKVYSNDNEECSLAYNEIQGYTL